MRFYSLLNKIFLSIIIIFEVEVFLVKRIIVFLLIVFSLCSCMADKHSEINKSYEIVYDNCGIGDYVDKVSDMDYI